MHVPVDPSPPELADETLFPGDTRIACGLGRNQEAEGPQKQGGSDRVLCQLLRL